MSNFQKTVLFIKCFGLAIIFAIPTHYLAIYLAKFGFVISFGTEVILSGAFSYYFYYFVLLKQSSAVNRIKKEGIFLFLLTTVISLGLLIGLISWRFKQLYNDFNVVIWGLFFVMGAIFMFFSKNRQSK